ncbi:sigma-54-dependent Fis family transcriptional regulator [bacterium]|nr:sigma-54-dependent Fis family transcriptional regulator [bacterium]RQV94417.1 MAG: sigma-54-dependent Fis family transcriptional regulator [bacterium]
MEKKRIIVVDDDKNTRLLIENILTKTRQYDVIQARNGEACLRKLNETHVNLILLDLQMPGIDGIETLKRIKKQAPHIPVIIMTAHGTIEKAVHSMKLGSYDFLTKPFPAERLKVTVKNALEAVALETEVKSLRSVLDSRFQFKNIIGRSGVMQEVFRAVEKVIDSDVTVLIQGESGTGKELIARAIHNESKVRHAKPFVAVNCTALPESLLESELFGHEKGAFTGAASRRIGKFELANGGTVFLDEIGEMSPSTQAKILRVLQEREFERLGGNALVKVNIRLLSATNKNLEEEVRKGTLREDLYYRISVFPIKLPPLRERKEDIPLLVSHFLERYSERENKKIKGIQREALNVLLGYHWPGNVRELENAIERAVVINNTGQIIMNDLPQHIVTFGREGIEYPDETLPRWIERLEIEVLQKTLLEFEGNITQAAKKLGIGRATIYRKAKKYNLPISK